jgi:hypothetical protein
LAEMIYDGSHHPRVRWAKRKKGSRAFQDGPGWKRTFKVTSHTPFGGLAAPMWRPVWNLQGSGKLETSPPHWGW